MTEWAGAPGRATHLFHVNWCNDHTIYHAVLGVAQELLQARPDLPDEAVGLGVLTVVEQWCRAATTHHAPDAHLTPPLVIMAADVGDFELVDPTSVGEDVRDAMRQEGLL